MVSRRGFLTGAATVLGAGLVSKVGAASIPEAQIITTPNMIVPPAPSNGRPFNPVVTLNGWSAPWRMKDGWKEFHLIAEPVIRELAPGMKATLWGYNGSSPGPTIEVVEGDKVRLFVTNKLPEATTIHWHGQRLPAGMDGVGGLVQPQIPVGKTFVYEFEAKRPGTFMYHPHADEMVQMAMGMKFNVFAQTASQGAVAAPMDGMATGSVVKVNNEQKKVTIKHGPLKNLDMPAMTMVFRVADPAMLESVKQGDNVEFHAEKVDGAITITHLQPAK